MVVSSLQRPVGAARALAFVACLGSRRLFGGDGAGPPAGPAGALDTALAGPTVDGAERPDQELLRALIVHRLSRGWRTAGPRHPGEPHSAPQGSSDRAGAPSSRRGRCPARPG